MFINGMGNISPQRTWGDSPLLQSPLQYQGDKLTCVEPDYTSFIEAKQIRRMSRVIKMGIASAAMAMKEANVSMPDGIITATGYGCLEDTGIFLTKMVDNKEEALNPTPFIQSTHNTIGSQIALMLQCQAYNQTYTHGAFSFEGALLDALLQLSDSPARSLLVGGVDEITALSHSIQSRFGIFRTLDNTLDLLSASGEGTVNGEGAAFFVLSGKQGNHALASIEGLTTFYRPADERVLENGVIQFLTDHSLSAKDIDLVLWGKSGGRHDHVLDGIDKKLFTASSAGVFKNLCGEYPVASAFALALAAEIAKQKQVPEFILQQNRNRPVKNILIFNQYFGTHYALIYLRTC